MGGDESTAKSMVAAFYEAYDRLGEEYAHRGIEVSHRVRVVTAHAYVACEAISDLREETARRIEAEMCCPSEVQCCCCHEIGIAAGIARNLRTFEVAGVSEVDVEYAVFNDPAYFEPLFASGELPESARVSMVDCELFSSPLPHAAKKAMSDFDEDRASYGTLGKYGRTVLRRRAVVRSPWVTVVRPELDHINVVGKVRD